MEENKKYSPLVTVLMPCYNAMPYLNEALESIINQTYTNLEILCINDGSTDETGKVLEQYAKDDNRIHVVHNKINIKLIATLNKGIQLSKGEYIARMDADDVSSPNRIENLLAVLNSKNIDLVSCKSRYISETSKVVSDIPTKCFNSDEIKYASFFFTPIGHAPLLGKRKVFDSYLYSESKEALHVEDYELWTRMLQDDIKFYNLDEVLYDIRINEDSVSRKYEELQIDNFILCANRHQEKFLNRKINLEETAVSVNRIKNVSLRSTKKGIKLINEITQQYISLNKLGSQKTKEIKAISAMQKTDIAVQLVKKGKFILKIYGFCILIQFFIKSMFNQKLKKYLQSKF